MIIINCASVFVFFGATHAGEVEVFYLIRSSSLPGKFIMKRSEIWGSHLFCNEEGIKTLRWTSVLLFFTTHKQDPINVSNMDNNGWKSSLSSPGWWNLINYSFIECIFFPVEQAVFFLPHVVETLTKRGQMKQPPYFALCCNPCECTLLFPVLLRFKFH